MQLSLYTFHEQFALILGIKNILKLNLNIYLKNPKFQSPHLGIIFKYRKYIIEKP